MIKKVVFLFNVIFSVIFSWILVLATWNMIEQTPFTILFLVPTVALLIYFLKKIFKTTKDINYKKLWIVVQVVSAILMIVVAFCLEVIFSWDWGQLIITASNIVDTGIIDNAEYYARYPNNQFWLMLLIWFFKFVKVFIPSADIGVLKDISIVLSCIFVQLTILIIYKIARLVWNEKKAFFVGLMAVMCVPLYLFAQYAYTDTSGMLVGALMVYLYLKMRQAKGIKKKGLLALLGIAAALTYEIKVTVFIIFIAIILDSMTRIKDIKEYALKAIIVVAVLTISIVSINKVVSLNIQIDKETAENAKFPLTHWVMMALNDFGGYVQSDVEYTKSYYSYEDKKKANIKEIKKRAKNFGVSGIVKHVGYTKIIRTWGNSSLSGDEYVNRYPEHPEGISYNLLALGGKNSELSRIYMNIYYFVLIAGILLSALLSIRRKEEQPLLVARIAVFGLMLFMCIWECNARYLAALLPILILTSADGLITLHKRLQKVKGKN